MAARPVVILDGDPTPEDPIWWDGPLPGDSGTTPAISQFTGGPLPPPAALARVRRENLMRAFRRRRALLADTVSTAQVADMLNLSPRVVRARLKAGALLAIHDDRQRLRYPAWQFDRDQPHGTIAGLRGVLRALRRARLGELAQANWFMTPSPLLANRTPLEALHTGDVGLDDVLAEAEALAAD